MRPWEANIRRVVPYVPGDQPKGSRLIKLNTNENPYPPAPGVARALREMDPEAFRKYPDPSSSCLVEALSARYGVDKERIFVGVGSDDVIGMAFLTFFNSEKPVLFPDISYSFYPVWADLFGILHKTPALDGEFRIRPEDYYQENMPVVQIALDPLLTPQQNAAKYYKRYNKAKTAEKVLREQIEKGKVELEYLESILEELWEAEGEQDFRDIRAELKDGGYLKQHKGEKKQIKRASKPRLFHSSAGLRISVGRNNRQNDLLTCKEAAPGDLWFHTQKIHGSHVILHTAGQPADEQSMREAAQLAAYYSRARESQNVPVDYTPVRYVKKPAGAKPGMVIYTTYRTVYVTPEESQVKTLREE